MVCSGSKRRPKSNMLLRRCRIRVHDGQYAGGIQARGLHGVGVLHNADHCGGEVLHSGVALVLVRDGGVLALARGGALALARGGAQVLARGGDCCKCGHQERYVLDSRLFPSDGWSPMTGDGLVLPDGSGGCLRCCLVLRSCGCLRERLMRYVNHGCRVHPVSVISALLRVVHWLLVLLQIATLRLLNLL